MIRPQFEGVKGFSEGFAAFSDDGKWGFVDQAGNVVIAPQFLEVGRFCDGRAAVQVETTEPIVFDGKSLSRRDRKWGYIDTSGKMVIKAQYRFAFDFEDGLAPVHGAGGRYLINKDGQTVTIKVLR